MYGERPYPYVQGHLLSPLYEHGQRNYPTSSNLVDFTCRSTWATGKIGLSVNCHASHHRPRVPRFRHSCLASQCVFKPEPLYPYKRSGYFNTWSHNHYTWSYGVSCKTIFDSASSITPRHLGTQSVAHNLPYNLFQTEYVSALKRFRDPTQSHDNEPHTPLEKATVYQQNFCKSTSLDAKRQSSRHSCPFCHVTCSNNGQLQGHIRIHTGERPFSCNHIGCGKSFARNEELTRHKRIHTGLKPYHCEQCEKSFGRKDHLNKHRKTHLRRKENATYSCKIPGCEKTFSSSDALARHRCSRHAQI